MTSKTKKPASSVLIEESLYRVGLTKNELIAEMRQALGSRAPAPRTFHTRLNDDGNWTPDQARWLAKRLSVPLVHILPYEQEQDDKLVTEAYLALQITLIELGIDHDIPAERASKMFTEWLQTCRELGRVDRHALARRMRIYLDAD